MDNENLGCCQDGNRAKRTLRRLAGAIAVAGILVLARDGIGLVRHVHAEILIGPSDPQPQSGRPVSVASDPAETRTTLVLHRVDNPSAPDRKNGIVVYLGRPSAGTTKLDTLGTIQSILERELIRQAILIAARDELGLSTRDELLDDVPASVDSRIGEPAEVAILFRRERCHALVRKAADQESEVIMTYDLGTNPDAGNYSPRLVAKAEELSRTEFPVLLKRLGAVGTPNVARADRGVPVEVERRLETLSMVEVFGAVRSLHEAIRSDGESPARLATLARAYAQLGILTDFHWHPAHRVFKARALLYAERLVNRPGQKNAAEALETRAFVRALVGRHDLALADLDASIRSGNGKTEPGAAGAPSVTSSWRPLIDAYLKADRSRLAIQNRPQDRLASFLSLLAVEYPPRTRLLIESARAVLKLDADCYRAYDTICQNGDLGDLHMATETGPLAFTKLFNLKLSTLPGVPEPIKNAINQGRDEPSLAGLLEEAGRPGLDAGEPSWSVLAHLARETRFVQVFRRVWFMTKKWNVPVDDYFQEVRPLVARHRYFPYLESLTLPSQRAEKTLTDFAEQLDLADIEPTERHMIDALNQLKLPAAQMAWRMSLAHCSILARDFCERLRQTPDRRDHFARVLLIISPYSSYAMGMLVQNDWDRVEADLPTWRVKVGDAPGLIGALGKKYMERKQYDLAEPLLKRYVEISGDEWAYQELSACYSARGDSRHAKETLDNYLNNTESAGLQHAQVQVEMANKLMSAGRFQEAKPYADAAAATWASFGMVCASHCYEGLKDWAQAEQWSRLTSERYSRRNWGYWYIWCKRTGRGDVKAARAVAEAHLAEVADSPEPEDLPRIGFYYWSIGSPKKAVEFMEKAYEATPAPLSGIAIVLIADELGDKARRDRMLDQVAAQFQGKVPRMVTICTMIRDTLASGGNPPLDLAAVDKILDRMPAKNRVNGDFLVGRYLLNRRQPAAARKYLKRCADLGELHIWLRLLATEALRSLDSESK